MDSRQNAISVKWAAVTLGVVIVAIGASIALLSLKPDKKISNFEECKASGGTILETYPEQCRIGGASYTNEAQPYEELPLTEERLKKYDYIGMREDDALSRAQKENIPARVVERDDESLPATMDFVPGRRNFYVRGGVVYKVDIEEGAEDDLR